MDETTQTTPDNPTGNKKPPEEVVKALCRTVLGDLADDEQLSKEMAAALSEALMDNMKDYKAPQKSAPVTVPQVAPAPVTPELIQKLASKYETPLQAVVRPEVVMGVSRYFLDRWVPVLGPAQATLVNTLRQLTYHAPEKPITRSGEALAKEASMSRRHLYKCLQSPWVRVFVQVESGAKIKREGRTTRHPNRYTVRQEDPLTPADAQHLYTLLRELADNPVEAMRNALGQQARQLWAESPRTPPNTRFAKPKPIFATQVVRLAFPRWQPTNTDEGVIYSVLTDLLHKHITLVRTDGRVSKVIVPQYFRKYWWSLLGHDLAWIYLWLRGRTYENEEQGVVRVTYWVPSLDTLLEVIGRPREWWRRNVDHADKRKAPWQISEFFRQIKTQKGHNPKYPQRVARLFTVNTTIPVAPQNRDYFTALKLDWPPPSEPEEEAPKPKTQPAPTTPPPAAETQAPAAETQAAPTAPTAAETPPDPSPSSQTPQTPSSLPPSYEERLREALASARGMPKAEDEDKSTTHYDDTKSHMRAQSEKGVPHSDTINDGISATSVHNTPPLSDTSVHKALPHSRTGSKHLEKEPLGRSHLSSTSHRNGPQTQKGNDPLTENAAAADDRNYDSQELNLPALLNHALRNDPQRPLYKVAPLRTWLAQGPDVPVIPHTPIWDYAFSGKIPLHDVVGMILAVRADASLYNQAGHLSWLAKHYVLNFRQPPVNHWSRFQQLAQMSIKEWASEGHRAWLELCTHARKNMPWYLDEIFREAVLDGVIPHPGRQYATTRRRWDEYDDDENRPYDGLDERPGRSLFSAYAVWRVALGHIGLEIGEELHHKWVDSCEPVCYDKNKKVLFVRAPNDETAEKLRTDFFETIQKFVCGAAQGDVTVRFVVGNIPPEKLLSTPGTAEQKDEGDTEPNTNTEPDAEPNGDAPSDADTDPPAGPPSAPDSS